MGFTSTTRASATVAAASDFIGHKTAGTLWGLFCERVRRTPDSVAYQEYDESTRAWRDHTWRDVAARIKQFRAALAAEELRPGDRVAVVLPSGTDWVCFDLAAHALGLVVVALYSHDTAASNAYILGHSDARLLLVDTFVRWQSFAALHSQFPALERVWIREGGQARVPADPILRSLSKILSLGGEPPPVHPVAPTSLATLIYTSGTTSRPKGVMLSHFALLWNAEASATVIPTRSDDVFLSILPLAHAFERTAGYYLPMAGGCAVAYARSPQDLADDLLTVRPTVLLAVPRLYERMYAAIHARAGRSSLKRKLLKLAALLGWRHLVAAQEQGTAPGFGERVLWPFLRRLVAVPAMAAFGGRLRITISGGASLDERIARFLIGLGLPLVEGYGLTEAAPVVTAMALGDNVVGSVGRPLPGVDLELNQQGELLVHSPR
ncbi:AMP-dependent synthetase/ligase [Chelativorans xinjiangense]|uniref:AMP-dependent synthetase/ligase n=1 Tax=Chelativorans xinjiangense TaxID=2681485 RepID=UPI00135742B5|nr:AMP-binding protein [Chelativorans xinjiangense]